MFPETQSSDIKQSPLHIAVNLLSLATLSVLQPQHKAPTATNDSYIYVGQMVAIFTQTGKL